MVDQPDRAPGNRAPGSHESGGHASAVNRPVRLTTPAADSARRRPSRLVAAVAVLVVGMAATVTGMISVAEGPTVAAGPAALGGAVDPARTAVVAAVPVTDAELAALPEATTFGALPDAPVDQDPAGMPSGTVLHPSATIPVYLAPGERPLAALPATQLGSDTWLPVIDERPGWARVLLPTRPGQSTGWVSTEDPRVTTARTPFRIVVDRATFTLTLHQDDREVGRWSVGIGKPDAITPAGRTFLLASIRETRPTFSDIVLPLGTHSRTHTTFGGGPGTVGIHTWPTDDVYGQASSDGCIRVPRDALDILSTRVPIGTPVLIG
jgi:lipoprotein-anchoring transpeptidase ErfK/SrfK